MKLHRQPFFSPTRFTRNGSGVVLILLSLLAAGGGGKGGNGGNGGNGGGGKNGAGKNGTGNAGAGGAATGPSQSRPGQAAPKPQGTTAPPGFSRPLAPEMPPGVTPREDREDARTLLGRDVIEDPDLIVDDSLLWGVRLDSSAVDRVITDPQRVYAISAAGSAYALDGATGDMVWSQRVGRAASARPALAGDRLVFPVVSGELIALDTATGAQRAAARSPGTIVGGIVSNGEELAFATKEGQCCVLDPKILKVVSQYRGIPGVAMTMPVFTGEDLVVADTRGKVVCFGRADGRIRWEKQVIGSIETPPMTWIQSSGSVIVVGTTSGSLTAFDASTGLEKWRYYGQGAFLGSSSVGPDLLAVFAGSRATVLSAAAGTLKREWILAAVPDRGPLAMGSETLLVDAGGKLDTYDAQGRVQHTVELRVSGADLATGIQGQGIVVVATADAGLYRIQNR